MQVGFQISRQEAIGQFLDRAAKEGQAARVLNVRSAPWDLARLIRSGRHMHYTSGISYLEIAVVTAFQAGCC